MGGHLLDEVVCIADVFMDSLMCYSGPKQIFSESKNKFGAIPSRNIKDTNIRKERARTQFSVDTCFLS